MTTAAATVPDRGGPASRRTLGARLREWAPPILLFLGFLVAWEVLVRGLGISQFVLPAPTAIAEAWVTYLPEISAAARYTAVEIVLGLVIGVVAGITVGLVTARFRPVQDSLMPFAVAASSVPILAFAPLGFLGIFWLMDPAGTMLIFTTMIGQVVLAIVVVLDYIAVVWARAILKLDSGAR